MASKVFLLSRTSFLLHHNFESVVVVAPAADPMHRLREIATEFGAFFELQPINPVSVLQNLDREIRPYFFCIEALRQPKPGRYLYVDVTRFALARLRDWRICLLMHRVP